MTPDHAARKVLMSAYLYYRCAAQVLDDHEYDTLSLFVADNWEHLHPTRKWQTESAEAIRSTGHHTKITTYTAEGAHAWYEKEFSRKLLPPGGLDWREDPLVGRWIPAEG